MRAALVLVAVVVLGATPLAVAQPAPGITSSSIAGIGFGMTRAQATTRMTKPLRYDRLEDGYARLASPRQKVETYFRMGTRGVAVVTTWSRELKTDDQIGPCSTIAALKHATARSSHSARRPDPGLPARELVFTVNGKRVGASRSVSAPGGVRHAERAQCR